MNTKENLLNHAKELLSRNTRNGFTIPTEKLYPFQWLWDSGFVGIGFGNYDVGRAISEIENLLKGQWQNGMFPHIIFHSESEKSYFPNWEFWNSDINAGAPKNLKTSGISQPPVLGFVLENLLMKNRENTELRKFVKMCYDKVLDNHRFWYKHRDPHDEKLVYIYHPWESGRDNSPIWDESMNRIDLSRIDIPEFHRRDTDVADASERPTKKQYEQYIYLVLLGQKYAYEGDKIYEDTDLAIQDSMLNAILIRSNQGLINIAEELGLDASEVKDWNTIAIRNYNKKLWNESLGTFVSYDMKADKQITMKEIGGYAALFGGIADDRQAKILTDHLQSLIDRGFYLIPSYDVDSPLFDSKRYWRGPIWPIVNWMIFHGLRNYNYTSLANHVKNDTLEIVENQGFCEYFEAQKDVASTLTTGYGGKNFSWTASTIIDLIYEK